MKFQGTKEYFLGTFFEGLLNWIVLNFIFLESVSLKWMAIIVYSL